MQFTDPQTIIVDKMCFSGYLFLEFSPLYLITQTKCELIIIINALDTEQLASNIAKENNNLFSGQFVWPISRFLGKAIPAYHFLFAYVINNAHQ